MVSVWADVESLIPDVVSVQVEDKEIKANVERLTPDIDICLGSRLKGHCRIWLLFRLNIVSVQADVEGSLPDMASVQV